MMPIIPRSLPDSTSASKRADAGGRQCGEDGDRVDVALVQHPKHDIHCNDGCNDEQQLVGERILERRRRALEDDLRALRQ